MSRQVSMIVSIILCTIILAASVHAEVLISEVLYDPASSESDTEFVELYNTGDTEVDLSGWSLNTTTVQATLPAGTFINPKSYFLISDIDNSNAWPQDWPAADFTKEISLTNTNSGLELIDNSHNVIDMVGWGHPADGLYLGTPHPSVQEGESLARKSENGSFFNTGNNSVDFLAALPSPRNSHTSDEPSQEIIIHASIKGNIPRIDSVAISSDDGLAEGIQIMPIPGKTKNITISAIVSDSDGASDISSVEASLGQKRIELSSKIPLNATSALYEGRLWLYFYEPPQIYTLNISVSDSSNLSSSVNTTLEYLGITSFEADTSSLLFEGLSGQASELIGDLDMSTVQSPTLRNTGNTPLDFKVSGTDLSLGSRIIPSANLLYTFLDNDFGCPLSGSLTKTPSLKKLNLQPGPSSFRELSLRLMIPSGTAAGDYQGSLYISGVMS